MLKIILNTVFFLILKIHSSLSKNLKFLSIIKRACYLISGLTGFIPNTRKKFIVNIFIGILTFLFCFYEGNYQPFIKLILAFFLQKLEYIRLANPI